VLSTPSAVFLVKKGEKLTSYKGFDVCQGDENAKSTVFMRENGAFDVFNKVYLFKNAF
jgi:hypothetical protein